MTKDLTQLEKYTLADLVDISAENKAVILGWGTDKGLIFSCELYNVAIELSRFDKETKEEKTKFVHHNDKYSILDLDSSFIGTIRKKREARPLRFIIDDWDYAGWWGGKPPTIKDVDLFVTKKNLEKFIKDKPDLKKKFNFAKKKKPGPKPNKLLSAIENMSNDIKSGKETIETLSKLDQDSLGLIYNVSRGTAKNARKAVIEKLNCQN